MIMMMMMMMMMIMIMIMIMMMMMMMRMMMMMMMIEYHINPYNKIIFCIMRCVSVWSVTGENQVR